MPRCVGTRKLLNKIFAFCRRKKKIIYNAICNSCVTLRSCVHSSPKISMIIAALLLCEWLYDKIIMEKLLENTIHNVDRIALISTHNSAQIPEIACAIKIVESNLRELDGNNAHD